MKRQSTSNTFPSKIYKRESKLLGGIWAPKLLPTPSHCWKTSCVPGGPLGEGVSGVAAFTVSSKGLTCLKTKRSLPIEYMHAHMRERTLVCIYVRTHAQTDTQYQRKTDTMMRPLWVGANFRCRHKEHTSKFLFLNTYSEI